MLKVSKMETKKTIILELEHEMWETLAVGAFGTKHIGSYA